MGMSMGLLNQTLGTGSLQPLWIDMANQYGTRMQQIFTASQMTSILQMLQAWGSQNQVSVQSRWQGNGLLSPLDKYGDNLSVPAIHADAGESASVTWALNTLYSDHGQTFLPQWQSSITDLGNDPDYISLQVQAADFIHQEALQLMQEIGVNELRSYLLMFDFVVQDGGIYSQDLSDYSAAVAQNPGWSNTTKLLYLMNLRLRHVSSQWANDVRSRKSAIINGIGTVHGAARNLPAEYCYVPTQAL